MAVYRPRKNKKIKWPSEPYHKREMMFLNPNPDPNSDAKKHFIRRKPTFWESVKYYTGQALIGLIRGIIWPFQKLGRILYEIFWPKSNFQDNGICGPGYAQWYERHFSWGKLSFVLVIAFIIIYFIFLR